MVDTSVLHRVTGFTPVLFETYSPTYSPVMGFNNFSPSINFLPLPICLPPMILEAEAVISLKSLIFLPLRPSTAIHLSH
jgi:hypothetical protein